MLPIAAFSVLFLVLWGILILAKPLVGGGLARTAHFATKFRYRDYLPVILLLGIGAAVTVVAGDSFADLAEMVVVKSPTLQMLDQRWHDSAISERTPGATTFFVAMSLVGGPMSLAVLTVVVAGALFIGRRPRWAAYLLVTVGGGALLNLELKRYFGRARPALVEMLRSETGYSFPSGHAMGATVVFGGLTYLSLRALTTWPQKAAAISFGTTVVVSVAASRVYLGVHWLSDIGAGVSAGLIWLATTTIGYETFRRIRLIRALRARSRGAISPPGEGAA
jgi:membrane-associated phospholipid phosphatase